MSETVKKDFPEGMAIKPNVHRYLQSLSNPTEMMHTLKNELTGKKRPPIFFSPERQMHVLSRSGNPKDPKVIIPTVAASNITLPANTQARFKAMITPRLWMLIEEMVHSCTLLLFLEIHLSFHKGKKMYTRF